MADRTAPALKKAASAAGELVEALQQERSQLTKRLERVDRLIKQAKEMAQASEDLGASGIVDVPGSEEAEQPAVHDLVVAVMKDGQPRKLKAIRSALKVAHKREFTPTTVLSALERSEHFKKRDKKWAYLSSRPKS